MKAILQRVNKASVTVDGSRIAEIQKGLLVLLGVKKGDTDEKTKELADRCANLRIFEDDKGKFNLSLIDTKGEALVVSQFTLLADMTKGRRPSFSDAEEPEHAKELYESFISYLRELGITAKGGIFGARMLVSLDNNGPVTLILEV
jgi:D-tyrosyl-tRNA(Tyr) deacylase